MRRTLTTLGFLLLLPTVPLFAQTFGAVMTGSQEGPAPTTDPGFGNATVTFVDATHINVTITVSRLGAPINNFHIHKLTPGSPTGPVVVNLIGLGGVFVNNKMTGTFPIDAATAADLIANPQSFYVNVHTTQFPNGAIRGFLTPASGTVVMFAADLKASNEAPPVSSNAIGSALVTIDTAANTLTYQVASSGIVNSTLSHIHGPGGTPGNSVGVFIGFTNPVGGKTSGTITMTTPTDIAKLAQIIANPNEFYVNLHSSLAPTGEIRGQLVAAKEVDIPVAGQVSTFVTDVRVFNPSYDTTVDGLIEYFPEGTGANTLAANTMIFNIPPRATAVANNISGPTLLNSGAGKGALRITSASPVNVTSRIFSDLRLQGKGTFGQFLPGLPRASALRRGVLPQLENDPDFRTNVGFFNPNTSPVTVRLDLRDQNSNIVATSVQTFAALSQQQNSIGTYFPGVDLSNKPNLTLSFDANAPIHVYAAPNDNLTTDSYVVVAQEDTGVATNP